MINPKISRVLRYVIPFLLLPVTVVIGSMYAREKMSAYIILAVTVLTLALLIFGSEKKGKGSGRAVLIAIFTALAIVGRFIPIVKPVCAIIIIGGIYLGAESGFAIGAFAALISNFSFGQGPWTPFQMLGWGLIGLIAGLCSGLFRKNRIAVYIYGGFCGILYSFLMDVWTALWYESEEFWSLYVMAIVDAVPYTIVYAVSNVLFLIILLKPFGRKLERVKIRYGL